MIKLKVGDRVRRTKNHMSNRDTETILTITEISQWMGGDVCYHMDNGYYFTTDSFESGAYVLVDDTHFKTGFTKWFKGMNDV